jgi:hypothetical protein
MIGELPTALEVGGISYPIRSDYRVALLIFQAYEDPELSAEERNLICIRCLYEDVCKIPRADLGEALQKAFWFLDGGDIPSVDNHVKTFDWEQDEKMIFSEVNKVSGFEVRAAGYLHWWTFLGYFSGIGEGLLSTIMSIRNKRAKGKKLEKWEKEFICEHHDMINFRQKLTKEEQEELDFVNGLFE